MAKVCCVCSEAKESADNRLFTCKGHPCDVTVHQACYGIVALPSGQWFCRKCESQERAARVRCELCPRKEGALKRTDSGSWAHVVCALYIPEVTFGNTMKMEPIVTTKLPRERFSKSCYLCEEQGLENQATYGACMSCHKSSCRLAFHVTCAQKEHLLCEEEDPRDQRNIIYCGYCHVHFKKMIRQKYKQSLRKVVTTPTTSAPPPLLLPPSHLPSPQMPLPPPLLPPLPPSHISKDSSLKDKPKDKRGERERDLSLKRVSSDAPLPPAKRRSRKRKFSSSNESSASEALSTASDIQHHLLGGTGLATSPSSTVPGSLVRTGSGSVPMVISEKEQPVSGVGGDLGSERMNREGADHSHSLLPVTVAPDAAPQGVVAVPERQSGSTSSDQSLLNRSQVPPLSLLELLERQWEQTAQLILDQAGKQNNAGVMLAHLHELQSENRRMQSRIMELASQREFYIATNTRLRQTLSENEVSHLPNGVQPPVDGIQQALRSNLDSSASVVSLADGPMLANAGSESPAQASVQHNVLSSSLPKAAQDSLLHAHFLTSSLHFPYTSSLVPRSSSTPLTHDGGWSPLQTQPSSSQSQENAAASPVLAHHHHHPSTYPQSTTADEVSERTGGVHDVTQVTNSIQAPLSAHAPLPSYGMHAVAQESRQQSSSKPASYSTGGRTNKEGR